MSESSWWSTIPFGSVPKVVRVGTSLLSGSITVAATGIRWYADKTNYVRIPWPALRSLSYREVLTEKGRGQSAFGVGPVGVAIVAATAVRNARAGRVWRHVEISMADERQAIYRFRTSTSLQVVRQTLDPVLAGLALPHDESSGALLESPTAELVRLAELHRVGELTDEEFSTAKARLLGG